MQRRIKAMWFIEKNDIWILVLTIACLLTSVILELFGIQCALAISILCSLVAAGVFYIAQILVPKINSGKKAMIVLERRIAGLYKSISTFNAIADEFIIIDDDSISINHLYDGIIYYRIHRIKGGDILNYKNICDYLFNYISELRGIAEKIDKARVGVYLPKKILEQIDFILTYDFCMIKAVGEGYPDCPKYSGLGKDIDRMKELEKKLAVFVPESCSIKITSLTEEEILNYKMTLKATRPFINSMNEKACKRRVVRSKKDPLEGE